ncbi:MAG: glycosyltransferase [Rhodobacteraceae bacterium]|nr:glycosyltransferase [Paracoccaceae bacterium]
MPLLTCITTTHNDGALLATGVRSVLAQGFADFEYIVVDDGSTDDTADRLAAIADPRLRVLRQANAGLSSARNRGVDHARGDYVCFLDADDSRPDWAFAAIARAIGEHAPDVVLCRGVLREIRGEPLPFYDSGRFGALADLCPEGAAGRDHPAAARIWAEAYGLEPQAASKAVARALIGTRGLRFPDGHYFEDVFFHSLALAAAGRIAFVQTPCFTYFRRYARPQITATAGERRFDVLAVMRMTLDAFALTPDFDDPACRGAVLASCLKLAEWCATMIARPQRAGFRALAATVLALADPRWLDLADTAVDPALLDRFLVLPGGHADAR